MGKIIFKDVPVLDLCAPEMWRRFISKVKVDVPDVCWLWQGSCQAKGYGRFRLRGKIYGTHRLMYAAASGTNPGQLVVMHTCDVPQCVSPFHLKLATQRENVLDMVLKGRKSKIVPQGEEHGGAVLTSSVVQAIRDEYAAGAALQRELASKYGVCAHGVTDIVRGKTWKSAAGPITKKGPKISDDAVLQIRRQHATGRYLLKDLAALHHASIAQVNKIVTGRARSAADGPTTPSSQIRLPAASVVEIRERYAAGALQRELAAEYGVSTAQISRVILGKAYPHVSGPITKKRS